VELTYDYIVENNNSKAIFVSRKYHDNSSVIDTIQNNSSVIINTTVGYGTSVYYHDLKGFFESFNVISGTDTSRIDYLDNNNWEYRELSDTHAEYWLVVDSTHFE
jgi:hypothetical protein